MAIDSVEEFFRDVLVVIVIYHRKATESAAFQSLVLSQPLCSGTVFVYDNSPTPQMIVVPSNWRLEYQHDAENPGVSKAYNAASRWAMREKKRWLLLADQDTTFPTNFIEACSAAIQTNPSQRIFIPRIVHRAGQLSPFQFRGGRGRAMETQQGLQELRNCWFINSGLCVDVELFHQAGGYDEHYPLDFSDIAFHHRVRKITDELIVVKTTCEQDHSSASGDKSAVLTRWQMYVHASRRYGKEFGPAFRCAMVRLARAIKLSIRFRSWDFLATIIRNS